MTFVALAIPLPCWYTSRINSLKKHNKSVNSTSVYCIFKKKCYMIIRSDIKCIHCREGWREQFTTNQLLSERLQSVFLDSTGEDGTFYLKSYRVHWPKSVRHDSRVVRFT